MSQGKPVAHTPGPWEIASGSPYRVMWVERNSIGEVACSGVIVDTANNAQTRTPENAANARLIAASPTMLEALKEFVRQLKEDDAAEAYPNTMRMAEAAIKEATGESQ